MKIFQTTQKYMSYAGFIRDQNTFNKRQSWTILKLTSFLALNYAYLFAEASTPRQYMNSIFMTTAGSLIVISHISVVLKTVSIFDSIDDLEKVINESECQPNLTCNTEMSEFCQFMNIF